MVLSCLSQSKVQTHSIPFPSNPTLMILTSWNLSSSPPIAKCQFLYLLENDLESSQDSDCSQKVRPSWCTASPNTVVCCWATGYSLALFIPDCIFRYVSYFCKYGMTYYRTTILLWRMNFHNIRHCSLCFQFISTCTNSSSLFTRVRTEILFMSDLVTHNKSVSCI